MRVSIGGTELTSNTHGEQSLGLRINGGVLIQEVRHFRAAEVQHVDRGNNYTVVTFSVSKLHASATAAEVYVMAQSKAVAGKAGQIVITGDDGTAAGTIDQGIVAEFSGSYDGAKTTFTYELRGGAFN